MSQGVFSCSFKLKKGASVPDFLLAAERLNNEYISKQAGYLMETTCRWRYLVRFDNF